MKHLPRQIPVICAATDVTPSPGWRGYDVAVYAPGDDLPAKDPATGLYALPAGNPVKTLSVRRENGGKRAVVTILRGGADPLVSVYDYAMGDWSLTRPSGVREEKERQIADSRAARIVTTVRTPQGDRLSRRESNFKWMSWGFAMTNRVDGFGGVTETTSWTYHASGNGRGQVATERRQSGLLVQYAYDALDRIVTETRSGPGMMTQTTTYAYVSVDPADVVPPVDARPRTVVRTLDGIECERTYYAYTPLTNVVERVGAQGAAYGGTNALRTVTAYWPVVDGDIRSGFVASIRHEDGRLDEYDYALASNLWTRTITHLHELSPQPVDGRTTRDIMVTNWRGETVETRTEALVEGAWHAIAREVRAFAASCLPPVSLGYDALGHVSSIALPGPGGTCRPTTVTNNWRGNPLSVALPDGTAESFAYDGNGRRVVRHVDALGREDAFKWVLGLPVHAGRIVNGVTNALFGVEHDRQLNVVAITDPLGRNAETYVFDENERVVAVTNLEGQAMSCEYAVGGFFSSVTRFDGTGVSYGYDADANLAAVNYPDATLAFTYDGDGLLTSAANATGTVSNEYDAATGWLVSSQGADGTTVEYSRRNGDDVASVSSVAGETAYAFDDAGRWTGIDSPAGTFGLGYCDWNGRLAAVTNAHGLVTEYAYDIMDRVTNIAWRTTGGATLGGFAYAYDAAGRIVSRDLSLGGNAFDRQYAYDALDRLVSDGGVSYAYDAAGNRTSRDNGGATTTYTRGIGDRLASWTGGAYSYNAAGCVTRIERTGRPTLDLAWNGQYQLVSVSTNGVFAEGYAYDALGRRVSTTNADGTVRHVYDDDWQCIADIDGQGNVVASYVWGEGIDNLLAVKIGDETYYPLTDVQGTVWGYADSANNVVARWTYDAWGNVLSEVCTVSALATIRYRFQGREHSVATGLVNFRARWYDPETGRWLSKDPIGLAGGLNLYAFCGDDPANANDPSGTDVVAIGFPVFAPSLPELGIGTSIVVGLEVGAGIGAFGMGFVLGQQLGAYTGLDEFMFDFGADIGNWISLNFAAEHTKNARPSTREKHQKGNARRERDQRRAKERHKKTKKSKKHKKHQGVIIVIPDDEEEGPQLCE